MKLLPSLPRPSQIIIPSEHKMSERCVTKVVKCSCKNTRDTFWHRSITILPMMVITITNSARGFEFRRNNSDVGGSVLGLASFCCWLLLPPPLVWGLFFIINVRKCWKYVHSCISSLHSLINFLLLTIVGNRAKLNTRQADCCGTSTCHVST